MSQALTGRGGRVLGKSLLTLANMITVAAPLAADWNRARIFNERWPSHARFHAVTALAMSTTLSSANLWSRGWQPVSLLGAAATTATAAAGWFIDRRSAESAVR